MKNIIQKIVNSKSKIIFYLIFLSIIGLISRTWVVFPIMIVLFLLIFALRIRIKGQLTKKNNQNTYKKILITIPAYNESLNIEKVIIDLRLNFKEADILVINDCSTDNTPEILEKLNVKYVTTPFNLRYAHAIQTGIKYARDYDYDCVIQFDGDGQHLAKEAKKLWQKMKENNNDVVIGSRFLSKTDYKHPFFRKIGTKFFSIMIEGLTGKKIYDPTSGLQCLNKNVISYYSKLGVYPEFPDANLITDLLLSGYSVEEVSVKMKLNEQGVSMHNGILKPIKYMLVVTYSIILIAIKHIELEWKIYE